MSKKNYLLVLTSIILIFLSYNYLNPLGNGYANLDRHHYALLTSDINNYNKYSTFRDDQNGKFSIYVEKKKTPSGIFTFYIDRTIVMHFSISEDTPLRDIQFTVKKNRIEIDRFIVSRKLPNQILLKVDPYDKVEIIADQYGQASTNAPIGNVEIKVEIPFFQLKNILIPFLWSILFIFLLIKKHSLIAINSYFIFLLMLFSEKLNFGILIFLDVFIYTLLVMSTAFLFTLLYQEFHSFKKYKMASLISFITAFSLFIIPLSFIIYALNSDTKITSEILYAVFQSNGNESLEYISDFVAIQWIALFMIVPIVIGLLLLKQEKKETIKIDKYLLLSIIITLIAIASSQLLDLRLPQFVVHAYEQYKKELQLFKNLQAKRRSGKIQFTAEKNETGETYFVVIGESLNKNHMGLYGYPRNTTPLLSKINTENELLVFQNTYSSHTHTVPVLSLSLTEANQMNKKNYYESLSIIDILNKSNIETYWLTNQTLKGVWDNMISVLASESDHLIGINYGIGAQMATQKYDGELLKEVDKALAEKTSKNKVIFVHLMGNHIQYCSRYPIEEYSIFTDELNKSKFGKMADIKGLHYNLNCYDNSVFYNDYVVGTILKKLQELKGTNGFIYISDHADDVIKGVGHDATKFTYEMTKIPMIAWFSPAYIAQYGDKFNLFKKHRNMLYSNDFLYDTLIGLFNVKTDRYDATYDLSSQNYIMKQETAFTLHGKKHYADKTNYRYWQKVNTQYLIDTNQSARIFPHRVNSTGKLKNIWNDGFRSFEIDAYFVENNTTYFQIGHNSGLMGMKMEDFLSSIDYSNIERVWLDFKNLNKVHYAEALARLNYLDKKFNLKRKCIIESSTTLPFFKTFKKEGWHTSYYMPTKKIITYLTNNNIIEMKRLALKISKQVELQNLSALSFDDRVYPFIKQYMEPLISKNIVYHVWYAPPLRKTFFSNELLGNKLYLDKRVKTILSPYKSQFDL